jgi:sterol desaturase/sphingolipid hydroxylase (fatty acid hydroxylase superfamily)
MDHHSNPTGPLTTLVDSGTQYVRDSLTAFYPEDLQLPSLLLTLVLASLLYWYRSGRGSRGADGQERPVGFLTFLLPKDIYTHVSVRVDIALWFFEALLRPLWIVSLIAVVGPATERTIIATLVTVAGESPMLQVNFAWMALYSLVNLLFYDFVFFLTHYTMHKVPALWAIHKVHHSAEVLTPLTRHREHFLAGPIWAAGAALSYGAAAGIFGYLFAGDLVEATLMNIGLFTLLIGFNGTFRHYHVQFNYPIGLSKWLQSPAMHHVHHSYREQHWDKNMAALTSIWDRIFGTLYIPEKDEYTPWGLGPETQGENRSFWHNTIAPFREWWVMLGRGKRD